MAHAVDMITLQAVKIEASDVHFRPGHRKETEHRQQVRGVPQEVPLGLVTRAAGRLPENRDANILKALRNPYSKQQQNCWSWGQHI
jgi:hypothetical protein